jgi:hypothetical protein
VLAPTWPGARRARDREQLLSILEQPDQPIKQAKATVASPTLMGNSDIMAMPTDNGIAMAPAISPAAISRPVYFA